MAEPTAAQRRMYAKAGIAMPDGSYYIRPDYPDDLPHAIASVGRATGSNGVSDEEQRNAVRCHIMKRANALKRSDEIPPSWNSDGTLKHMDVDDILEHFGVKGMHWGVHHTKEELESQAGEHEKKAAQYVAQANKAKKEDDELLSKGLQSSAFKRVYGEDAHKQGEWQFYGQNGQTRAQALEQTHNNLRMYHNQNVRAANHHAKKAARLREKAAQMEHGALVDEQVDDILEHFGVKGMKWGVHKSRSAKEAERLAAVRSSSSTDAKKALAVKEKVSEKGVHSLTNKELETLAKRMRLEQEYSKLTSTPKGESSVKRGRNFVQEQTKTAQVGINAWKTGQQVAKILGPLIVAAAAGAAASKATGGQSGPIRMPQLAITSG
jgi:hypothetical protein